jgi:hypothetical protein
MLDKAKGQQRMDNPEIHIYKLKIVIKMKNGYLIVSEDMQMYM